VKGEITMTDEEILARDDAAIALGLPTKEYRYNFRVTTRTDYGDGDFIEATSMNAAVSRLLDPDGRYYPHEGRTVSNDEEVAGDQVLFISAPAPKNDEQFWPDEEEVDARPQGEPFSWTAVDLVRSLARAGPGDDLTQWLVAAREACRVPAPPDFIEEEEKPQPTMNRTDLLDCAKGNHDFDETWCVCRVCGISEEEEQENG
jgi:hypothetical protein